MRRGARFMFQAAGIVAAVAMSTLSSVGDAAPSLAQRYNDFGFDLFSKTDAASAGQNVVISPVSVAFALAMAQNGAAAKTHAAIAATLHATDLSDAALNAGNEALLKAWLQPQADIQFAVADSLWIKNGFPIHANFANSMERLYRAKVTNIPFDAAGLIELNTWVKQRTLDLIPKILDQFQPLDSAVLVNALALKAKWRSPFDPHNTSSAPFHSGNGITHSTSMMRRTDLLEYASGKDWQLVRLPYRGNHFAMYIFLPARSASVAFSHSSFEGARARLQPTSIALQLPRFAADFKTELDGPLSQLGMGIAFDATAANFSRMTSRAVYISRVSHVTHVRIDEAGTEAAAATAVVITTTALIVPHERMLVDHPFYMIIRDDQTGQILFLGHITTPA